VPLQTTLPIDAAGSIIAPLLRIHAKAFFDGGNHEKATTNQSLLLSSQRVSERRAFPPKPALSALSADYEPFTVKKNC
jgi:hypothetical protein